MKNKLVIGALRHRVALQTYTETPYGAAETEKTWQTIASLWASIEAMKGLVYFDTKQIGEAVTHKITVRYDKTLPVTTENWILYQGKRYRIRSVRNLLERRRYLELLCEQDQEAIDYFEVSNEAVSDPLRDLLSE